MTLAILPVKNPRHAKQRLKGFLSMDERENLARAMFEQTLGTLLEASGIDEVAVATSDEDVAQCARRAGVLVFEETAQVSHSISADMACARAVELGISRVLLVPIDVPLATSYDFTRLAAATAALAIVPSADGTGTNALVRTPPDVISSCFGPGSFQAHLEQARAKGIAAEVLRLPGVMFDVDTPEDVRQLLERAPHCRVASFLRTACALK